MGLPTRFIAAAAPIGTAPAITAIPEFARIGVMDMRQAAERLQQALRDADASYVIEIEPTPPVTTKEPSANWDGWGNVMVALKNKSTNEKIAHCDARFQPEQNKLALQRNDKKGAQKIINVFAPNTPNINYLHRLKNESPALFLANFFCDIIFRAVQSDLRPVILPAAGQTTAMQGDINGECGEVTTTLSSNAKPDVRLACLVP